MRSYLVFMPEGKETVEQEFPSAHYHIADDLWVVGSPSITSVDVCEQLGIKEGRIMVVVPMAGYYGHHDRALWMKVESWSAKP